MRYKGTLEIKVYEKQKYTRCKSAWETNLHEIQNTWDTKVHEIQK
jgi:hypothetical protein